MNNSHFDLHTSLLISFVMIGTLFLINTNSIKTINADTNDDNTTLNTNKNDNSSLSDHISNKVYGYARNNAVIHQKPNDSSQELGKIKVNIWDSNNGSDNGNHSHTNIPIIATPDSNDMYKVNYHNITGYIDKDSFTTKSNYDQKQNFTNFTRNDMMNMVNNNNDHQYQVPNFKGMKIKDIPAAKGNSKQSFNNGKIYYNRATKTRGIRSSDQLDIWDSWPLQNKDSTVADYHGYHLVFALGDNRNTFKQNHRGISEGTTKIYLFYQKANAKNKGIKSWHNAGPIFLKNTEGSKHDPYLKQLTQDWSGSAFLLGHNDMIRLFYTNFSGSTNIGGTGGNDQIISTANINIKHNQNKVWIDHKNNRDNKSIFRGNGGLYQSSHQFQREWPDNWAFDTLATRDPHLVYDHGQKYLTFESSTGLNDGYQGINNLFNMNDYGGTQNFQSQQQRELFDQHNPNETNNAQYSNAALGIVKLNKNNTVNSIMHPLVAFNGVSDEIERPNIIHHNGKWYLFGTAHDYHFAKDNGDTTSYMLGFNSDKLMGPYHPMNGNGLVLASHIPNNQRTYTYSYYALPQKHSNNLLITSYMTSIGNATQYGGHATFAPSFELHINGNDSSVVNNSTLPQGTIQK